jgi:hypothetical protein
MGNSWAIPSHGWIAKRETVSATAVDFRYVAYVAPVDQVVVVSRCGHVEKQLADASEQVLGDQVSVLVCGGFQGWFLVRGHSCVSVFENGFCCLSRSDIHT